MDREPRLRFVGLDSHKVLQTEYSAELKAQANGFLHAEREPLVHIDIVIPDLEFYCAIHFLHTRTMKASRSIRYNENTPLVHANSSSDSLEIWGPFCIFGSRTTEDSNRTHVQLLPKE